MSARLLQGDCLQVMADMLAAGEQVDAIVTDPPYHLTSIVERFGKPGSAPCKHGTDGLYARQSKGFMGKTWDGGDIAQRVELWELAYALLKPGGHMLAFSSTRTQHRMVCAIEDAGFEVRDQIGWVYGSGFPKSLDVSRAIDKAAGAEREVVGTKFGQPGYSLAKSTGGNLYEGSFGGTGDPAKECAITAPATPEAQQWAGWGTALKPAWEPICVARKPLSEKNVAANVLEHGTGAINIDGCRIPGEPWKAHSATGLGTVKFFSEGDNPVIHKAPHDGGRWPANILHDGSDEVLEAFAAFGESKSTKNAKSDERAHANNKIYGEGKGWGRRDPSNSHNDTGTAARFFYSAKASKADRAGSKHPTVKPLSLMRYLCKLVTPPGGTVLDMFAGSGTTLQAALEEGFSAIGIEREDEYARDIRRRLGMEDDTDALMAELFA